MKGGSRVEVMRELECKKLFRIPEAQGLNENYPVYKLQPEKELGRGLFRSELGLEL